MRDDAMKMNLQFFADGGTDGAQTGAAGETGNSSTEENLPTREELLEELAQARTEAAQAKADREKYKNSVDDLTKKNKNLTQAVRERMSADEQAEAAKQEAENARNAEVDDLKRELAIMKNTAFWGNKKVGMDEELARKTAEEEATGSTETFHEIIQNYIETVRKSSFDEGYQRQLKERPDVAAGNGNSDKNSAAIEMATASAKRMGGVNEKIINQYRR